jgi:hypothetical protein
MTVQEIIDALSDYGFTDTTSIRKLEKINAALWDLSSREPWPFLEQSIDLTFDGTNPYPSNAPVDLQSVLDIVRLDTGTKLQPVRLQEADEAMSLLLTQAGTPYYYYFIGSQLRVAQVPSASTTLRMRYTRLQPKVLQTDIESAILLPKEHHEVLLLATLVKLYDLEDDTDLSVRFQQLYEKGLQDMRSSIWMRQYDRPDHIKITDRYDDFYD